MPKFFSDFRQKLLIIVIGLSVFLIPGPSQFSMAQNGVDATGESQLFLPIISAERIDGLPEQALPSNDLSPNDHGHFISHRYDRFTGNSGTWPPQPKNIENVVSFTDNQPQVSAASMQLAHTTQVAAANAAVQSLLGARYTHIGTVSRSDKGDEGNSTEIVTYFSHSSNSTIDVQIKDGLVVSTAAISPLEYQPPLTTDEIDDAVAIARSYWAAGGHDRVAELEGFGILGLKPAGYYDVRVVYVSFHINADARPEYVGYVDLTNQAMLESWEE